MQFQNVTRRIFGPKRENVGHWIKPNNEELHNLYPSPNIIRMIKSTNPRYLVGDACSVLGEDKKCVQSLGWKI
jgi:hypothetical protein